MPAIRRLDNALVCHAVHETVRIEPWGVDSLRVRATMAPAIQDGPLSALLDPVPSDVEIEIDDEARHPAQRRHRSGGHSQRRRN